MCTPDYPHPSLAEEAKFNQRNANIVNIQNNLTGGHALSFSSINELVSNIRFMRMKNKKFNIQFGLCREIP